MRELYIIDMINTLRQVFNFMYIFSGVYDIILLSLALRREDDNVVMHAAHHFFKDTLLYTTMIIVIIFILSP